MTEQTLKSPSKRRQRHITFPGSAARLLNEDQNDLDSQDRTRRFSLMDTLRSSDLADPLHGDLSFSMPHLDSGARDEILPSMDENERKEDTEEIELANMKARRRKTNTEVLAKGNEEEVRILRSPPSFARSEFETIVRRLRNRSPLKKSANKPRFKNMSYDWQFAGWGSLSYLDLSMTDLHRASDSLARLDGETKLGQFTATSIAGNAVWGSVYYSLPAIAATADIYSCICMLVSCCILFLLKPVLLELGSAMRIDGANYIYLLNTTSKALALIGAAVTVLDAVATGIVSAATAASYIDGEVSIPFPDSVLAIIILAVFTGLLLLGVRESSRVTLSICVFHCATMFALVVASFVHWGKEGNAVIAENWKAAPSGGTRIARSIFNGICIGLLGVTGFESPPAYIAQVAPAAYPKVLRNLIWGALATNLPILLITYAVLPSKDILSGSNILSLVGERAAGTWLRKIIVVDSAIVLCGGVLTGAVTTCSLIERLAGDRALPKQLLMKVPKTGALWAACALYLALCIAIYAASGLSLSQSSNMFSMAFMAVLFTFIFANFMLKFNRDALKREYRAPIAVVFLAMAVLITTIVGNLVQTPIILLLWGASFVVITILLFLYQNQPILLRWTVYLYDNLQWTRKWRYSKNGDERLIKRIKELNKQAVCIWIKDDDIAAMVRAMLYVKANEATTRVVFIHAYTAIEAIPSELEANAKIVDEAFPDVTTDLVLIRYQAEFGPELVHAVAHKLEISPNIMFITCLDQTHPNDLAAYHGVRVIGA